MSSNTQHPRSTGSSSQARRMSATNSCRLTPGLILLACLGISLAQAAGSLYVARNFPEHFTHGEQHITLLPDDTIFKYSSCWAFADICAPEDPVTGYFAEVSLWNPATQRWDTESVDPFMSGLTSTLTHDGRIVMVGGRLEFNNRSIATTAIYDSHTQTFRTGPTLKEPRYHHTATELSDGGVLVVGGGTGSERTTAGVELITAGGWRKTKHAMLQDRANHTATRLPSGDILVVGGSRYIQPDHPRWDTHATLATLDSVELYNAASDRWSAMPPLPAPRMQHSATLLPDGRVMIIGGTTSVWPNEVSVTAAVLLWNPATGQWSATRDLPREREGHIATLLPNGDVLVSGGQDEYNFPMQDLVLWDHVTGQWSNAGHTHDRTVLGGHTAAILPKGNVLLIPTDRASKDEMAVWSPIPERDPPGSWVSPSEGAAITRLTDGRFLMVGGEFQENPAFYAHLYDPATRHWSDTGEMHYARVDPRATRLADGRVLVFGGGTPDPYHGQRPYTSWEVPAEIWDPGTGKWTVFPGLVARTGRRCNAAFLNGLRQRLDKQGHDCKDDWSTQLRGLADGRALLGVELSTEADAPKEYGYRTWIPGDLPPTPAEHIESPRSGGRLILLDDGSLLYVGGRDSSGQPSAELDIFEIDSKRWRAAGKLQHPIVSPGILDLGDQRLLIFERSGGEPISTADLWDEASGSTQAMALPPDMVVSHARGERPDETQPFSVRTQYASETVRPDSWRAIGLSSSKILLLTEERSYLSEPPYERWETIHNEGKLRTAYSPIASLKNGKVLAFTGIPLPLEGGLCDDPACTDYAFTYGDQGQYEVSEFDSGEKQWHSIFPLTYPEKTLRDQTAATAWPASLTRSDGPFHFLIAPHRDIELRVYSSVPRDLFLAMCLIAALIYWKKRRPARSATNPH
jgi:N-acetylneuraminic acid mutarotase